MRRVRLLPTWLIPLLLVASCADEPHPAINDRFAEAYCQALIACGPSLYLHVGSSNAARAAGVEGCSDYIARRVETIVGVDFDDLLATGDYDVDEEALATCQDKLVSTCFDASPTACEEIIDGRVPIGGACETLIDCAGDAYCPRQIECPTCTPRAPLGAACENVYACSQAGGPATCFDGVCRPATRSEVGLGASCAGTLTASGYDFGHCVAGLNCVAQNSGYDGWTCQPPLAVGSPCESDDACDRGASCQPNADDETECQLISFTDAPGDPCGADAPALCNSMSGLFCSDGRCVAVGDGSLGSACEADVTTPCDSGLVCVGHICVRDTEPPKERCGD